MAFRLPAFTALNLLFLLVVRYYLIIVELRYDLRPISEVRVSVLDALITKTYLPVSNVARFIISVVWCINSNLLILIVQSLPYFPLIVCLSKVTMRIVWLPCICIQG